VRTTIDLDDDVAAAVGQVRRERGLGLSAAVNELVRVGLRAKPRRPAFEQHAQPMGARIDLTDVSEALEILEDPGHG
jgi:Arc/MetJ family transcription regulator